MKVEGQTSYNESHLPKGYARGHSRLARLPHSRLSSLKTDDADQS